MSTTSSNSSSSSSTATASPIAGGDGNREFLFWLAPRPVPGAPATAVDDMLGAIDLEGAS